jgi:hypothetical protein
MNDDKDEDEDNPKRRMHAKSPIQRALEAATKWHFDQHGLFTDLGEDEYDFVYIADKCFFPTALPD